MNARGVSITLIGPGGAGKVPSVFSSRNNWALRLSISINGFGARFGDISKYIDRFGYNVYSRETIDTCNSLLHEGGGQLVAALSSGFMTYPRTTGNTVRRRLSQHKTTSAWARLLQHQLDERQARHIATKVVARDALCLSAVELRRVLAKPFQHFGLIVLGAHCLRGARYVASSTK